MDKREGIKKLWTRSTHQLLMEVDSLLERYQGVDYTQYKDFHRVKTLVSKVWRARNEFEAMLFFIVICGPVKAGKSTLTNILAREYVSPTEMGQECTLRPSIVIESETPRIEEYFSINVDTDQKKEIFDLVIDYLRGTVTEAEIENKTRRVTSPLESENLANKLTVEAMGEGPLTTVIHVPGGNLIGNGVAILDMPGFDGFHANREDDPMHGWVMERADLIIFVQSSVAAINKSIFSFLKNIGKETRGIPIWLVHNIIQAKSWRTKEDQDKEIRVQRGKAKARIKEELGLQDIHSADINLGLAWDGIHLKNSEWFSKSEFESFESKLQEILKKDRARMQETNCLNGMEKCLSEVIEQIAVFRADLQKSIDRHKEILQTFDESTDEVGKIAYGSGYKFELLEKGIDELLMTIYAYNNRPELNGSVIGRILNQTMEKYTREVAAALEKNFNIFGSFGSKLKSEICEYFNKTEADTLQSIENLFAKKYEIELKISTAYPVQMDHFPQLGGIRFSFEKVKEKNILGRDKTYKSEEVDGMINSVYIGITDQTKSNKNQWYSDFINKLLQHCEDRKQFLKKQITEAKEKYEKSMEKEISMITNTLQMLETLNKGISDLQLITNEASALINAPGL